MDIAIFLRMLRRSAGIVALTTIVGLALGIGAAVLRRPTATQQPAQTYYSATETLGYDPSAAGQTVSDGLSDLATVASFATGQTVSDAVGTKLGLDGADAATRITTVTHPTTNSLDITAYADSPRGAQELASTFAAETTTAYTQKVAAQATEQATQLTKRLEDLKARRSDIAQQLLNPVLSAVDRDTLTAQSDALVDEYRIAYDRYINLASPEVAAPPLFTLARARALPIDAATYRSALERGRLGQNHLDAATAAEATAPAASGTTIPTGPVALGVLGALFGFAAGLGIVLLRARFDRKLRTRADFEDAFGLPILGGVPEFTGSELRPDRLVTTDAPFSRAAEVFRSVRAALLLLGTDDPDREGALVVMMSSAQPQEGKSTNTANLAAAFAEAGRTVLAVNCDYRRPTLHRYFGAEDQPGVIQPTSVRGLWLTTNVTAPGTSPGLVAATQRRFVDHYRKNFDVIILDTAPLMSTSDPVDVVSVADFVVVIGRPGHTEREHARLAVEILDRHRATIAGVVLTSVENDDGIYYYYAHEVPGRTRAKRTRNSRKLAAEATAVDEKVTRRQRREARRTQEAPRDRRGRRARRTPEVPGAEVDAVDAVDVAERH